MRKVCRRRGAARMAEDAQMQVSGGRQPLALDKAGLIAYTSGPRQVDQYRQLHLELRTYIYHQLHTSGSQELQSLHVVPLLERPLAKRPKTLESQLREMREKRRL